MYIGEGIRDRKKENTKVNVDTIWKTITSILTLCDKRERERKFFKKREEKSNILIIR